VLSLRRPDPGRVERKLAKLAYRRIHPRWPWWATVFVALVVLGMPALLVKAIGGVIAVAIILFVRRHPVGGLLWLIVLVPFQLQVFPALYRVGMPAEVVRSLGQWKEIVIIGVLLAGWSKARQEHHRLDALDYVALGYVALGTLYLALPGPFVGDQLGAGLDFNTRLMGWRTDVLYIALFVACRHLRLDSEAVRKVTKTFLVVATVIAAVAFYEFFFAASWNNFMVNTLQLPQYKLNVLNINPLTDHYLYDIRVYTKVGGHDVLRAGSVMLSYWTLGYYMVIAAAVLTDRIVRGLARPYHYGALALACGATLFTNTRSAVLALGAVLVVTLVRRSKRTQRAERARVQFALVLGAVAIVAIPAAFATGLVNRINGEDDYSSNAGHATNFDVSYALLASHPLGRGLATAAGAGQRADVNGNQVTETQYLQIGTQLGVLGLVLWLATLVGSIVALGRVVGRAPPYADTRLATSLRAGLIGMFVAGIFLQVFIDFPLSWTVWLLAGVALGHVEGAAARANVDVPARSQHALGAG